MHQVNLSTLEHIVLLLLPAERIDPSMVDLLNLWLRISRQYERFGHIRTARGIVCSMVERNSISQADIRRLSELLDVSADTRQESPARRLANDYRDSGGLGYGLGRVGR